MICVSFNENVVCKNQSIKINVDQIYLNNYQSIEFCVHDFTILLVECVAKIFSIESFDNLKSE